MIICDTNVIIYAIKKNYTINLSTIRPVLTEVNNYKNIRLKIYEFSLMNNETIDSALIRFAKKNKCIIYSYDKKLVKLAKIHKVCIITPTKAQLYA